MKWVDRRKFLKIGGAAVIGSAAYALKMLFTDFSSNDYKGDKKDTDELRENSQMNEIDNNLYDPSGESSDGKVAVPRRILGKTGEQVSLLGLGGAGIIAQEGDQAQKETESIVRSALEAGINYIDTAPTYGVSESNLGTAFNNLNVERSRLFLASKTLSRDYQETKELYQQSLNRLQTNYIDLYQIHGVNNQQDLTDIMADGGSLQAVDELKKEGKIKYTGITGHREPQVLKQAIEEYDFDCLLMPLNAGDIHYKPFQNDLLSKAREKGMGIIAMKIMAYGNIFAADGIDSAAQALNYTCSFPVSTSIVGVSNQQEFQENISNVKSFTPLTDSELRHLEEKTAHYYTSINHFREW